MGVNTLSELAKEAARKVRAGENDIGADLRQLADRFNQVVVSDAGAAQRTLDPDISSKTLRDIADRVHHLDDTDDFLRRAAVGGLLGLLSTVPLSTLPRGQQNAAKRFILEVCDMLH